jgi:glycolate oxidase
MVEPFVNAGYDLEAESILLCEADGTAEEVEEEISRMSAVLREAGATALRVSGSEQERLRFWAGRKNAFPAAGRVSPDYYCMDGTIPRKRLGEMLRAIQDMEKRYDMRCPNVFHAGDGNLHPLILYDGREPDGLDRAEALAGRILEMCVAMGGSLTGEHGIGVEKRDHMPAMFSADELDCMERLRAAFDPLGIANPGKMFPSGAAALSRAGLHPLERAGVISRE